MTDIPTVTRGDTPDPDIDPEISGHGYPPETRREQEEQTRRLDGAGWSTKAIAEHLGIARGTVRKRRAAYLEHLDTVLEPERYRNEEIASTRDRLTDQRNYWEQLRHDPTAMPGDIQRHRAGLEADYRRLEELVMSGGRYPTTAEAITEEDLIAQVDEMLDRLDPIDEIRGQINRLAPAERAAVIAQLTSEGTRSTPPTSLPTPPTATEPTDPNPQAAANVRQPLPPEALLRSRHHPDRQSMPSLPSTGEQTGPAPTHDQGAPPPTSSPERIEDPAARLMRQADEERAEREADYSPLPPPWRG